MDRTFARAAALLPVTCYLLGCAVDVGDSPAAIEQGLSTALHDDFESYALGPLPAPWAISGSGASTFSVVGTSDHGHAARLQGGTATDFAVASRSFSSSDPVMHLTVEFNPAAGASFVFALQGAGSTIGSRRIRLQSAPGSNVLTAQTSDFGTRDCGALPSGVWSKIGLDVRTDTHTFDVTINGAATACTGGRTNMGLPFSSVSMMDASNEGWGGAVLFDNLDLASDAAPACTPPDTPPTSVLVANFDGDPLGALGAPWSITPAQGRSTLRVVSVSGHGRSLQLHGSTLSGDYIIGGRDFSSDQTDARFDFAIRPSSNASFVVEFKGAGGSIGARRIRLQRAPGSTTLVASTAGPGNVSCGSLPSGTWSNVSLAVHTQNTPHTFDVTVNGAATACTNTSMEMGTPFTGINLMDASNSGWGGDVLFDDLAVTGLGAPAGSCP